MMLISHLRLFASGISCSSEAQHSAKTAQVPKTRYGTIGLIATYGCSEALPVCYAQPRYRYFCHEAVFVLTLFRGGSIYVVRLVISSYLPKYSSLQRKRGKLSATASEWHCAV
jgi:hypothetical protein